MFTPEVFSAHRKVSSGWWSVFLSPALFIFSLTPFLPPPQFTFTGVVGYTLEKLSPARWLMLSSWFLKKKKKKKKNTKKNVCSFPLPTWSINMHLVFSILFSPFGSPPTEALLKIYFSYVYTQQRIKSIFFFCDPTVL